MEITRNVQMLMFVVHFFVLSIRVEAYFECEMKLSSKLLCALT